MRPIVGILFVLSLPSASAWAVEFDVLVYGGTSGGVTAW